MKNFRLYPLAYLITFRCYAASPVSGEQMPSIHKRDSVRLDKLQRVVVEAAIRVTCGKYGWNLHAVNVQPVRISAVVIGACKAGTIVEALKTSAERRLRETDCWPSQYSPWAKRDSKRNLWTPAGVRSAIDQITK